MKKIIIALIVLFQFQHSFAQKKVAVTFEDIKQECKDLPFDKRLRIKVARFSVTTDAPHELQDNLATMLTSALQQVNCYTVLESLKNASDTRNEIDNGGSAYTNKATAVKKGKQLGAQFIVTGEITKYSEKQSGIGIALVSVGSHKVKLGFTIQIINPETGVVVYSHDIDVEGKSGGSTSVGLFGVNLASTSNQNPAVSNACQQGVIQGVQYMASIKDLLQQPEADLANVPNETIVTLSNADFDSFKDMAALLGTLSTFKSMEKSFSAGVATYTLEHLGNDDDLLTEINKKIGNKYKVTGFGDGKIELSK